MSFTVTIKSSGNQFQVESGESILDAALRQGVTLPYGCRGGSCGACCGSVVAGAFDYPDGLPDGISEVSHEQGKALFCQARCRSDLTIDVQEVEAVGEIKKRILPARVQFKRALAHDVMQLKLKLPKTERLQFLAGQYLDILLKNGQRRAFSIANAPHDDEFVELHIRHTEGGKFTDYVFESMAEKALLRIEAPLGTFILREDSERPWLFVGGGTGFAPLKSMIEHAIAAEDDRPMHLFWGVRAQRDLYMADLPAQWAAEHDNIRFSPVLSDPLPEDEWQGSTGWVHEAVVQAYPDLSGFDIYISGPPIMVDACREAFLEQGASMDHMFSDSFDYAALTRDKED